MQKIRKAVIPAAGLGIRFLPATKAQPKEMLPIVDKPTIQFIVEEAIESGIEDIMIITGRNKRAIEDHFDRSLELEMYLKENEKEDLCTMVQNISQIANIYYVRQKEALGLGHAIYCARKFIENEPFAVLLGDDIIHSKTPCLKQMINVYDRYGVSIVGVQEVPLTDMPKYGIVEGRRIGPRIYSARNLIEKPSIDHSLQNPLAIMGRYILTPEIFNILENLSPGKGGEIQLTDGLCELRKIQELIAYQFKGRRYDVGDKLGFLKANIEYGLRHIELNDKLMDYLLEIVQQARP